MFRIISFEFSSITVVHHPAPTKRHFGHITHGTHIRRIVMALLAHLIVILYIIVVLYSFSIYYTDDMPKRRIVFTKENGNFAHHFLTIVDNLL